MLYNIHLLVFKLPLESHTNILYIKYSVAFSLNSQASFVRVAAENESEHLSSCYVNIYIFMCFEISGQKLCKYLKRMKFLVTFYLNFQVGLIMLAKENEGLIVPGYTHLQRAQPVLLQHLLLSYVEQV